MRCNAKIHMMYYGLPHCFKCSGLQLNSVTAYMDTLLMGLYIKNWLSTHNAFQMPPVKIQGVLSPVIQQTMQLCLRISGEDVVDVLLNNNAQEGWWSIMQPHDMLYCERHVLKQKRQSVLQEVLSIEVLWKNNWSQYVVPRIPA